MYRHTILNKLLLKISSHELDQNCSHVVATHLLTCLLGHQRVQQIFQDKRPIAAHLSLVSDPSHHWLAVIYIFLPDTVAPHDYELVIRRSVYFSHIRLADDRLLIPVLSLDLFIVEVAKRAR